MRVVVGLGCDRDTSFATLSTALGNALESAGIKESAVVCLATIDKKKDEKCMVELAEKRRWTIRFYNAETLAQVPVPNPSPTVMHYMGTPAVAEAAALLAAGTDMSNLVVEKYKYRGDDGKNATVSIAKVNDE